MEEDGSVLGAVVPSIFIYSRWIQDVDVNIHVINEVPQVPQVPQVPVGERKHLSSWDLFLSFQKSLSSRKHHVTFSHRPGAQIPRASDLHVTLCLKAEFTMYLRYHGNGKILQAALNPSRWCQPVGASPETQKAPTRERERGASEEHLMTSAGAKPWRRKYICF